MNTLAYKATAGDVVERLRALYERRATDRIFATFSVPEENTALNEFRQRYSDGLCEYPDPAERIDFWDRVLKNRPQIEDDSLPSAYPNEMDMGLWGGLFGAETLFECNATGGSISSNAKPVLKDWSEIEQLRLDLAHPWFQRYLRQLKVFAAGARGKFGVSPICLTNGFHFSWALMGPSEAYLGVAEHPDMVRRAMELSFEVNTAVMDAYFDSVPLFMEGTFSLNGQWLPGKAVMESVDAFSLTSVPYFEEWGRASLERIFARYDGGEVHLHGNGRHQFEAVSSVKGLTLLTVADDGDGVPPALTVLDDLRARAGNLPLKVYCSFADFSEKLEHHKLTGGVLYTVSGAESVAAANRCMQKVRSYRV